MEDMGEEVNIRIEVPNDEFLTGSGGGGGAGGAGAGDDAMEWDNSEVANQQEEAKDEATDETSADLEDGEISEVDGSESVRTTSTRDNDDLEPDVNDQTANVPELIVPRAPRRYINPYLTDEAKKRFTRAMRFKDSSLNFNMEEDIAPLDKPTDDQLLDLYSKSSLITDDGRAPSLEKLMNTVRSDSILIRGLNNMSTDEIFSYLYKQGLKPKEMEWVNDACCVVIYEDKYEAAASLLKATKPVAVDPRLIEKKKSLVDDDDKNLDDEPDTKLQRKDSEMSENDAFDYDKVEVIPYKEVLVPMPLGHVWRLAKPCDKSKGVLMRFALASDKKQERAEKHSEYYKKYGNPNKEPGARKYPRRDDSFKKGNTRFPSAAAMAYSEIKDAEPGKVDSKNVWASLSQSWNEEENPQVSVVRSGPDSPRERVGVEIRHKTMSARLNQRSSATNGGRFRRAYNDSRKRFTSEEFDDDGDAVAFQDADWIIPRKRGRESDSDSDTESRTRRATVRDRLGSKKADKDSDDDERWTARLTTPRMSMHADDEEKKIQQRAKLEPRRRYGTSGGAGRFAAAGSSIFSSGRLSRPVPSFPVESSASNRGSVKDRLGKHPAKSHRGRDVRYDAAEERDFETLDDFDLNENETEEYEDDEEVLQELLDECN